MFFPLMILFLEIRSNFVFVVGKFFFRLQNVTPVSYSEALFTKNDKSLSSEVDLLRLREEGAKPEFYTEEQEKLLGSTEMEWTLFIDGVGRDGKRIYDPVKGKTCHQCRLGLFSFNDVFLLLLHFVV